MRVLGWLVPLLSIAFSACAGQTERRSDSVYVHHESDVTIRLRGDTVWYEYTTWTDRVINRGDTVTLRHAVTGGQTWQHTWVVRGPVGVPLDGGGVVPAAYLTSFRKRAIDFRFVDSLTLQRP